MRQSVITFEGKDTGRKVILGKEIFGLTPNEHAIYLDVKRILAKARQGTSSAKERGEVRGSRKKILKQKGSGNARRGDKKASILRGGGVNHGPRPRSYNEKVNKKTIQLARKSALSVKAQSKNITILENFSFEKPKTKNYLQMLTALSQVDNKTLLVLSQVDTNILLAARNLPKAQVLRASDLNTYAILNAKQLLVTEEALASIKAQLS